LERRVQLTDRAYRRGLVWAFLAVCLVLAIEPADRLHWAAENLFVVALAVALYLARRHVTFSKGSCTAIFVFLCLHEVGAHYLYADVPYEAWLEALTGTTLAEQFGMQRNHYDRLVHFAFGLLITAPIRELLVQTSPVRGRWSYLLPVGLAMAAAMAYEVAEWLAVALVAPEGLGASYLGMQGDMWDAQKDMALGAAGAMLAMTIAVNLKPSPQRAKTAAGLDRPESRSPASARA
jgi:putative membrane protein